MYKRTWYLLEAAAVIIILVIAVTLMLPKFLESQNNINTPQRIPDPNFRAFIEEFMDVEPGSVITKEQADDKVDEMRCVDREIQSLKGIEYFSNIHSLSCGNNKLKELDLSEMKNLVNLYCANNVLESIIFPTNSRIEVLDVQSNFLQTIDITNLQYLTVFRCANNKLTSLSCEDNAYITVLSCSFNQLKILDISSLLHITDLFCDNNQISQIKTLNHPRLNYLYCNKNILNDLTIFKPILSLNMLSVLENDLTSNDLDLIKFFLNKLGNNQFKFEKQNNGTFQIDPNHGGIRFLPSKTTE